jgi:hypothetical protein
MKNELLRRHFLASFYFCTPFQFVFDEKVAKREKANEKMGECESIYGEDSAYKHQQNARKTTKNSCA